MLLVTEGEVVKARHKHVSHGASIMVASTDSPSYNLCTLYHRVGSSLWRTATIEILKQGVDAWNRWRDENPEVRSQLRSANLFQEQLANVDLQGADLTEATLSGADLSGANLRGANLQEAELYLAKHVGAELLGADLSQAYLTEAQLSHADLLGTRLRGAFVGSANLREANLYGARLQYAELSGSDLMGKQAKSSKSAEVGKVAAQEGTTTERSVDDSALMPVRELPEKAGQAADEKQRG